MTTDPVDSDLENSDPEQGYDAVVRRPASEPRSSGRLGARVLLALIAGLVSLELLLQTFALVVWSLHETPEVPRGGAAVVLCTGDSFTYGLRAEDRKRNAYPVAAQDTANRSDGPTLQFVNVGEPGQDSKRVRERLALQLDRYQPELVYLLVGYNDSWTDVDPDAIVVDKDPDAFVWEWRTVKMLRVLFGADYGTAGATGEATEPPDGGTGPRHDEAAEAQLLGPWHQGDQVFVFGSDRTLRTPEGSVDLVFTAVDVEGTTGPEAEGRLLLDGRATGEAFVWSFELKTGDGPTQRLVLEAEDGSLRLDLKAGYPDDSPLNRARQALLDSDLSTAEREFREALPSPQAVLELAELLIGLDRSDEAVALLTPLVPAENRPQEQLEGQRIQALELLLRAGEGEAVFDVIERRLTAEPDRVDDRFIAFVTRVGLRAPDVEAFDRVLETAGRSSVLAEPWRVALLAMRIDLGVDEGALIDALVEIGRLRRDEVWRKTIRFRRAQIDPEAFRQRAALLPEAERDALVADFEEALATEDLTLRVLGRNLRAMVNACRSRGVEPVILTYPGGRDELAEAQREFAKAFDTGCVDLQKHFAVLLDRDPRSKWFVADGHCNDRGYREMGRLVAEDALQRVEARVREGR